MSLTPFKIEYQIRSLTPCFAQSLRNEYILRGEAIRGMLIEWHDLLFHSGIINNLQIKGSTSRRTAFDIQIQLNHTDTFKDLIASGEVIKRISGTPHKEPPFHKDVDIGNYDNHCKPKYYSATITFVIYPHLLYHPIEKKKGIPIITNDDSKESFLEDFHTLIKYAFALGGIGQRKNRGFGSFTVTPIDEIISLPDIPDNYTDSGKNNLRKPTIVKYDYRQVDPDKSYYNILKLIGKKSSDSKKDNRNASGSYKVVASLNQSGNQKYIALTQVKNGGGMHLTYANDLYNKILKELCST